MAAQIRVFASTALVGRERSHFYESRRASRERVPTAMSEPVKMHADEVNTNVPVSLTEVVAFVNGSR